MPSPIATPAGRGWRPGVVATTPIESCHGAGALSGSPEPIVTARSRPRRVARSLGFRSRPVPPGAAPGTFSTRRTPASRSTVAGVGQARSLETAAVARRLVVPRLLQVRATAGGGIRRDRVDRPVLVATADDSPTILDDIDAARSDRLTLAARVITPAEPGRHALILAAIRDGRGVGGRRRRHDHRRRGSLVRPTIGVSGILAVGVEPIVPSSWPCRIVAGACVAGHAAFVAEVTLAERDPIDPSARRPIPVARRLLERAGFEIGSPNAPVRAADPGAIAAVRLER